MWSNGFLNNAGVGTNLNNFVSLQFLPFFIFNILSHPFTSFVLRKCSETDKERSHGVINY
jgi:hypothetical protein